MQNSGTSLNEVSLNDLNCAQFSAVSGTTFQVSAGTQPPVPLKLIEVKPRPGPGERHGEQGESFSLFFAGPRTRLLPQRLYWFAHETLGRFEMFIVPVAQDATTFSYEAVFNRIHPGKNPV